MARFKRMAVYDIMIEGGLVPLFYHADLDTSKHIAQALYEGGSRVLEFTNRGDFAIEVFNGLVKYSAAELPELVIGIGSVDDAPTAAIYIAYGANFVVGPTFNPKVARLCNRHKIAYLPGCSTLNEIATAEEYGIEIAKLFPGKTSGGPNFVKAIRGPRPWTSIMPTGGVNPDEDSLRTWFEAGVACVGMGSKLVRKDLVQSGDYAIITDTTRTVLELIKSIRMDNK